MTIPLGHFVVGFGFLLAGAAVGVGSSLGFLGGLVRIAHLHLLLVGWVCVTIMGAMTQFVPVWSGVSLHSRPLAVGQLALVATGLVGLAGGFLTGVGWLLVLGGVCLLFGLWTFVYNLGRTLWRVEEHDVTERHFGVALLCFAALAPLGLVLAVGFVPGLAPALPVARGNIIEAHATLAVFGGVLTTVIGALYQLATMFTQTELHGIDRPLQRIETGAYPIGVALLATGRLVDTRALAVLGGVLVVASVVAVAGILARKLAETRVEWTPMLSRYAVAVGAVVLWAALTLPAWLADPLGRSVILGGPQVALVLVFGVVAFVVFGTLYHVVPFIVWVHRYSDRLGFEPVPMIDDLYSGRVATADLLLLVAGVVGLVTAEVVAAPSLRLGGAALLAAGSLLFVANMVLMLVRHGLQSSEAAVESASEADS
jgi:hypothetical protein